MQKTALSKLLIGGAMLMQTFAVYAGGMGSGGGNGVVCFSDRDTTEAVIAQKGIVRVEQLDRITSLELLDYRYAKLPKGVPPQVPALIAPIEGVDYYEILEKSLARINTTSSKFAGMVQGAAWELNQNTIWRSSAVEQVFDVEDPAAPQSELCTLTTMAVQRETDNGVELHIDSRLFYHERHNSVSRATLFLHEYVYKIARSKGAEDSKSTRDLVAFLLINEPSTMVHDLVTALDDNGFGGPKNTSHSNIGKYMFASVFQVPFSIASTYIHRARILAHGNSRVHPELVIDRLRIHAAAQELYTAQNSPRELPSKLSIERLNWFLDEDLDYFEVTGKGENARELYRMSANYVEDLRVAITEAYAEIDEEFRDSTYEIDGLSEDQVQRLREAGRRIGYEVLDLFDDPYTQNGIPSVTPDFDGRDMCAPNCGETIKISAEELLDRSWAGSGSLEWDSWSNFIAHLVYEAYHDDQVFDYRDLAFPVITF